MSRLGLTLREYATLLLWVLDAQRRVRAAVIPVILPDGDPVGPAVPDTAAELG